MSETLCTFCPVDRRLPAVFEQPVINNEDPDQDRSDFACRQHADHVHKFVGLVRGPIEYGRLIGVYGTEATKAFDQAMSYAWGRQDEKAEGGDSSVAWEFADAFRMRRHVFEIQLRFTMPPLKDAWTMWNARGVID